MSTGLNSKVTICTRDPNKTPNLSSKAKHWLFLSSHERPRWLLFLISHNSILYTLKICCFVISVYKVFSSESAVACVSAPQLTSSCTAMADAMASFLKPQDQCLPASGTFLLNLLSPGLHRIGLGLTLDQALAWEMWWLVWSSINSHGNSLYININYFTFLSLCVFTGVALFRNFSFSCFTTTSNCFLSRPTFFGPSQLSLTFPTKLNQFLLIQSERCAILSFT